RGAPAPAVCGGAPARFWLRRGYARWCRAIVVAVARSSWVVWRVGLGRWVVLLVAMVCQRLCRGGVIVWGACVQVMRAAPVLWRARVMWWWVWGFGSRWWRSLMMRASAWPW